MHLDGRWIKDEHGRTLLLRGVNLGGSSKVPYQPDGASHLRSTLDDHRALTFVGRPFPLDEADEHFRRLKQWGLTFVRFLITWEAIEHTGPGQYDEDYLDYVAALARKAGEYGILLFIDPHQDVWSRMTGGDGAPGWTLEAVGFEPQNFLATGAAMVHGWYGDPFPRMIWSTNYTKLACATMFTLFFAGNDFAPHVLIDGEPVQEYLQRHYIASVCRVVERLKGLPNVVGYDSLNEPSEGWIGWRDLARPAGLLQAGESPTPLQAMALGEGLPQRVNVYTMGFTGARVVANNVLNPLGERAWQSGRGCIWREHGVWDVGADGQPTLLRPAYFSEVNGRAVDFNRDYMRPFINRFAQSVRAMDPQALIFAEWTVESPPPKWGPQDAANIVCAPHWYDNVTLYFKNFSSAFNIDIQTRRPVLGIRNIRQMFARQLRQIRQNCWDNIGDAPVLIGEFGIPFDMGNRQAYQTGDFARQVQALDASYSALDANLLHSTLWNYTADNSNARGDLWNGEDLSIFSRDQRRDATDIDSGGRALPACVRPYARCTAGEPLRMSFDLRSRTFELEFRHDPAVTAPTEIFLPRLHYPHGGVVQVSDGEYELREAEQMLIYRHSPAQTLHSLMVRPVG